MVGNEEEVKDVGDCKPLTPVAAVARSSVGVFCFFKFGVGLEKYQKYIKFLFIK